MRTVRMADTVRAHVTYTNDFFLTEEEFAEFNTLTDGYEREEFLRSIDDTTETDTDIDLMIDSLSVTFTALEAS